MECKVLEGHIKKLLSLLIGVGTIGSTLGAAGPRSFAIDPAQSRALIDVGKAGAFSFLAGHTHEVMASAIRGVVDLDSDVVTRSTVRLEIDASALKVTGKGEPPKDVPEVQRVMLSDKVLDVERYPNILFQSTDVSIGGRTATSFDLIATGKLTLHNVTRSLSVPVHATLEGDTLTASGRSSVKQTDYGIKPVSVAGVVAVKDAVDISFTIVARERR